MEAKLQDELLKVAILYRLGSCHEKIPTITTGTKYEIIDRELMYLYSENLYINRSKDGKYYVLDKRGVKVMEKLTAAYDQFIRFDVFSKVDITLDVSDLMDEEGYVYDNCLDPRFDAQNPETTWDLRPAMMAWHAESVRREGNKLEELNPKRLGFLAKLANDELSFDNDNFWEVLKYGNIFSEIDEAIESMKTWESLGGSEEESFELAQAIYTAGMLEDRKRNGSVCSKCETPLAVYETKAQADGQTLDECPNPDCDADFTVKPEPEGDGYECPRCGSDIRPGQSTCYGCGAHIDLSLPAGAVTSHEVAETETVVEDVYDPYYYCAYDPYWGYTPYGYYDPFYPAADALAIGFVCGALLF